MDIVRDLLRNLFSPQAVKSTWIQFLDTRPRESKLSLGSYSETDFNPVVGKSVALKKHAVSRRTNAGLTMLFDRAKGVMYELNESASCIVELLSAEPVPVQALVENLAARFDAPTAEIEADVEQFLSEFEEAQLLQITP